MPVLVVEALPQFAPAIDQQHLERLAAAVLAGEGVDNAAEISLVVTDDNGIRAINRQYRHLDASTDVLSFSQLPDGDDAFVAPPDGILRLGDIVISYERVIAQAAEYGHPPRQELAELFVHGLLHILGYDHEQEADAQRMAEQADKYLQ